MGLMDLMFARKLVNDTLQSVLEEPNLTDEDQTLEQVGLNTTEDRQNFRYLLCARVVEEGYLIDKVNIPNSANNTLLEVASALPGHSTKGNTV